VLPGTTPVQTVLSAAFSVPQVPLLQVATLQVPAVQTWQATPPVPHSATWSPTLQLTPDRQPVQPQLWLMQVRPVLVQLTQLLPPLPQTPS